MKDWLFVVTFALCGFLVVWLGVKWVNNQALISRFSNAQELLDRMVYVRDARTGLCFGYAMDNGPVLVQVNCAAVLVEPK